VAVRDGRTFGPIEAPAVRLIARPTKRGFAIDM
jgi:hypothetical protein